MSQKGSFAGKVAAILIIVFFVGSMFTISLFSGEDASEEFKINGYTFYAGDGYITKVNMAGSKQDVSFLTDPRSLSDAVIENDAISLPDRSKFYLVFNPNKMSLSESVYYDLARVLTSVKGVSVALAFTEDSNPVDENMPLRTCADVDNYGIIEFSFGEEDRVYVEEGCIKVVGKDVAGLQNTAAKFAYWLSGIEI